MTEESQNKTNFSPESHAFNVSVAEKYGIEEAIFINHFAFWIKTNTNNKNNFIDGKVWMYQTHEEILHHFPYFKNKQKVIRTIQSLVDQKVIVKKSFNKCKFDRTNWFTFINPEIFVSNYKIMDLEGCTENGLSMNHEKRFLDTSKRFLDTSKRFLESTKMDYQRVRKWTIREYENGPPIPDNETYNKTTTSLIDDTCEDESCFFAVDCSLNIEKKTQAQKPKQKDRDVVIEDVQLKPEKKISLQEPIYKKEYTVPVKETQKVDDNFFCYVDEKFSKETIDAVQSFIKSSLDMKKDKDAITAAVEKFNATNVGAVQHVRGWLTKIINSTEPVFVQIKTDEPRIKTRIQIAKCLESMSTCGGSYVYDEKKLYHTTGTLTKEYTFTGNDYFWEEKERFVREEANKRTAKHV